MGELTIGRFGYFDEKMRSIIPLGTITHICLNVEIGFFNTRFDSMQFMSNRLPEIKFEVKEIK